MATVARDPASSGAASRRDPGRPDPRWRRAAEALLDWSKLRWHAALPVRMALAGLAVAVWWRAAAEWNLLYGIALRHVPPAGYDLDFSIAAEHAFLAGANPYTTVPGFVYPPSHLIVMLPLAAFSQATDTHYAELALIVALAMTAMCSAKLLGRRYWGLTAALAFFALSGVQPVGEEVVVENVSVLMGLALAATLLLARKGRWNWAAGVLGLSLAIKPILAPIVLVLLLARRWRALAIAIAVPVVLNVAGFLSMHGASSFFSILPFLFDRGGAAYDAYNAAIVSVGALNGLAGWLTDVLRVLAGAFALLAAWLVWRFDRDETARLVDTAAALMVGLFLAGSLTEDHYMLALIPCAMAVSYRRSCLRWLPAWFGVAWIYTAGLPASTYHVWFVGTEVPSQWFFGGGSTGEQTARCLGLALLLLTLLGGAPYERWLTRRADAGTIGPFGRALARLAPLARPPQAPPPAPALAPAEAPGSPSPPPPAPAPASPQPSEVAPAS